MIEQSALYLLSYHDAFHYFDSLTEPADAKGKKHATEPILAMERKAPIPVELWKKPPPGWAKLNSNASFFESDGTCSWGAILRNERGEVLMTAWGPLPQCINALTAEALGLLNGLRAFISTFAGPIHVENDNAFLVNELNQSESSKSAISGIAEDTKSLLNSFQQPVCVKVNRSANRVADALASLGKSVEGECVLLGRAPPCVAEALMHDCKTQNSFSR